MSNDEWRWPVRHMPNVAPRSGRDGEIRATRGQRELWLRRTKLVVAPRVIRGGDVGELVKAAAHRQRCSEYFPTRQGRCHVCAGQHLECCSVRIREAELERAPAQHLHAG